MTFSDTLVSIPHDTCIPISYGLSSLRLPQLASCAVNFERFTAGRLSYIPGIVKPWESPGTAGGLLRGIYNVYFKSHGDKVNITSTGEIGRSRYGTAQRRLNRYLVAYKLGQNAGCRYVDTQSEIILDELLPVAKQYGINMLTLLYWEQKIGNWGAIVNSESDIAIKEFDPYDSHLLCELLLSVDERYTRYDEQPCCVLFQKIIKTMWPELLEWPINPPYTKRDKIVDFLTKMGISNPLREIKYQISYMRYLFERRP